MTQLAIVGTETFTLGFRLAGIRRIWNAETPDELESAVQQATKDDEVSILVMETSSLQHLDNRVRQALVSSVKPTLVTVGLEEDNTLREKIKQAVGVDLW